MMSEVLDDERKEAFLQALHGLKEEQEESAVREKELQQQQQEQMEQQRRQEEENRQAEARRADEDAARRKEEARRQQQRPPDPSSPARPKSSQGPGTSRSSRAAAVPKKEIARRAQPASLYKRATNIFTAIQSLFLNTAQTLSNNPMALMRAVLFLLMFAFAFGRRDLRERARRMLRQIWEKVRATVGMGVKVSYI
jgi:hypothetical protein